MAAEEAEHAAAMPGETPSERAAAMPGETSSERAAAMPGVAPQFSTDARLRRLIRDIPDFPREGIAFKDITPLLGDADGLRLAVEQLARLAEPLRVDCVLAAEARGFLLGPALALRLGASFALARKPGKLPYETIAAEYALEYGSDSLELHTDAIAPGARVLVHDDLLATGGTAQALCELTEVAGGVIAGCSFLIELASLRGRARLAPREIHSLLRYDD
ncbi:MAG: adenine phosphoribosyltransferase [Solirubrobacteraceae bacterium]